MWSYGHHNIKMCNISQQHQHAVHAEDLSEPDVELVATSNSMCRYVARDKVYKQVLFNNCSNFKKKTWEILNMQQHIHQELHKRPKASISISNRTLFDYTGV